MKRECLGVKYPREGLRVQHRRASLAHTIARACSIGVTTKCSCGVLPTGTPGESFKWGGCGDDVHFGTLVQQDLRRVLPQVQQGQGSEVDEVADGFTQLRDWHGGGQKQSVDGLQVSRGVRLVLHQDLLESSARLRQDRRHAQRAILLGRRGGRLQNYIYDCCVGCRVDSARYFYFCGVVKRRKRRKEGVLVPIQPGKRTFTEDELIYYAKSPDYCSPDDKTGSVGTRGRLCDPTTEGPGNCDSMCCGRGSDNFTMEVTERCECKYYWCCYVKWGEDLTPSRQLRVRSEGCTPRARADGEQEKLIPQHLQEMRQKFYGESPNPFPPSPGAP
ncbi:hypothetical protein C0Q70_21373 [Pomacea canaliculata]|uniref:Protein Wnt n=1 Tax=Pomacea canaliculata TaxID=400727 RepID=A0A2T7NCB9_POMCA|nr:hypothetical protein C0Q70_21373 [Pomacea canaliculata]